MNQVPHAPADTSLPLGSGGSGDQLTAKEALRRARAKRISEGRTIIPAQRLEDIKLGPIFHRSDDEMRELARRFPELVAG
ncbi:MAG: hypothetical protein ACOYMN_11450 [Roseimicrobium sp.]